MAKEGRASMDGDTVGSRREGAALQSEDVYLYEGGVVEEERKRDITRLRIGPQVKDIPRSAFEGCINLAEVRFDEGALQYFGEWAFHGCEALQQVAMPSSVTKLGLGAFGGCTNLSEVHFNDGLQVIGGYAFRGCKALQHVTIPSSVTKLGTGAFWGCISLSKAQFNEGLEVIGYSAFNECEALQNVTLPSSVTMLDSYAFEGCINLTEVHFNDGLQIIGQGAFHKCTALQHVTIPSSVTKLSWSVFLNCINLTEVQFDKEGSLQCIGQSAFYECTALRSVAVPSSVAELGRSAFWGCANLTQVILLGGDMLLNRGFLDRGLSSGEGALNKKRFNEAVGMNAFYDCPLTAIKISVPGALSQRMARLPQECRLSVEGRIRGIRRLELAQDGTILACFPLIMSSDGMDVEDTNNQTAESLHQVLRLISFHELKESSILIEQAMWKSRFDEDRARADCRIAAPDPAKILIMEYFGFTDFLEPA